MVARLGRIAVRFRWQSLGILLLFGVPSIVLGQSRFYAGFLGGVATLSGDASSQVTLPDSSQFSLYDPQNGLAVGAFAGRDLSEYISVQANYIWNRNRVSLKASAVSAGSLTEYAELRSSSQNAAIGDVLIYFRARDSRFRPYLSVGTGLVHFSSSEERITQIIGTPTLPPRTFTANLIALHVPVGIDVRVGHGWMLRYAFSETLTKNPISDRLSPPGTHKLMNFQSLFGIVRRF